MAQKSHSAGEKTPPPTFLPGKLHPELPQIVLLMRGIAGIIEGIAVLFQGVMGGLAV